MAMTDMKLRRRHQAFRAVAVFACLFCFNAAWGQNRPNTNSTRALMHISVDVMPVTMLPPAESRAQSSVTYNLPVDLLKMDVTRETRPLASVPGAGVRQDGLLETVTAVPR